MWANAARCTAGHSNRVPSAVHIGRWPRPTGPRTPRLSLIASWAMPPTGNEHKQVLDQALRAILRAMDGRQEAPRSPHPRLMVRRLSGVHFARLHVVDLVHSRFKVFADLDPSR